MAHDGGLFSIIESKIQLRWFAKVVVSATMASRFGEVYENGMQDLMVSVENENSRKSTKYYLNVFQKWAAARKV